MSEGKNVTVKVSTLELKTEVLNPNILFKVAFYKHCLVLAKELYASSEPDKETPYLGDQKKRRLFGVVVFLAFALESFINDVAIQKCSEDFKSIDRLSTPDKWIIVPRLCSKDLLKRSEEPFRSISLVFKYRNLFSHFKPELKNSKNKDFEMINEINHVLIQGFYNNSVKAMILVRDELEIVEQEWLDDETI